MHRCNICGGGIVRNGHEPYVDGELLFRGSRGTSVKRAVSNTLVAFSCKGKVEAPACNSSWSARRVGAVSGTSKHSLGVVLTKRSACGLFETLRLDVCQSELGCANSISGVAHLRTRLSLPHQPTSSPVRSFHKPRPWCSVTQALVFAIPDNGARFTGSRWSDSEE